MKKTISHLRWALLLFAVHCALSAVALAATKTVTGTITNSAGTAIRGAVVEFKLVNWGTGNMPRVAGSSIDLAKPITATTGAAGTWSVTLHGNDTITPTGTLYEFKVRGPGLTQGVANYEITGEGSVDISTLTPVGSISPIAYPVAYTTIGLSGTALAQRRTVNFLGSAVSCVDNAVSLRTDCTISGSGTGTVTSFSAGTLSPLFTTSVATATTTPALSFSLSNAAGYTLFGRNATGSGAASYTTFDSIFGSCSAADSALTYNVTTHAFGCNTISGGSAAFSALTSATNTTAAMVVGTGASLAATGTGTIVATSVVSPTTSVAGLLSIGQGTAPSLGANAINIYAPASITTGFGWVLPSAQNASAGYVKSGAAASNINTLSVSAIALADLPATSRVRSCTVIVGDPGAASPVLENDNDSPKACGNDFGVDWTITGIACVANTGTPTVDVVFTAGASLLSSAPLSCSTSWASGALSGTPVVKTFSAGGATCSATPCTLDANITTAGGAAKYLIIKVVGTL